MKRIFPLLIPLLLTACGQLDTIPYSPPHTPESWLQMQPYATLKLGASQVILVQPSSTFFVYLLGLVAIAAGLRFLRLRQGQQTRLWWGIALLLWGFGALSAGTSYQAFSYTIKCAGRPLCAWTSWWEIAYLLLSAASVDAMVVAVAYSSASGKGRKALLAYAAANLALYTVIVLAGAFTLTKFMISFELLLVFAAAGILILFGLNGWRWWKYRERLEKRLALAWLMLGLVIAAYFITLESGMGHTFWARGVWFTENDVLHLGLTGWMVYLAVAVAPCAEDKNQAPVI